MLIEIDLTAVPPRIEMRAAHDVQTLKVTVNQPDHAFIERQELIRLAGAAAEEAGWVDALDSSLAKAAEHGWVVNDSVRAHLEWTT